MDKESFEREGYSTVDVPGSRSCGVPAHCHVILFAGVTYCPSAKLIEIEADVAHSIFCENGNILNTKHLAEVVADCFHMVHPDWELDYVAILG